MNKIKTSIGIGIAALIAAASPVFFTTVAVAPVVLTGCGTLQGTNSTAQIDATALIVQNTARAVALAAITPPTGNANNAAYFDAASQVIGAFLTGKDYSPVSFQKALIDINMPQAENVWVQLSIGAVVDLYQVYYLQYVKDKLNGDFAAGTFLLAIQNGFNQARGHQPVVPPALTFKGKLNPTKPDASQVLPRPLR